MDVDGRWRNLPSGPSLKHLTDPSYGIPPEQQKAALQDLTRAHVDSFNYAALEGLSHAVQAIPPFEFAFKDERISLTIVDAVISPPSVPKGTICKDLNVYPAECRGRKSTYRGRLTADISWAVNGVPKGIIKQFLGYVPIMVKSKLCNLYNLPPRVLIEHHEEAEEMGGYFIINGIEKVIRMLIVPRRNFPIAMVRPKWKSRGLGYTQFGVSMRCVREEHSAVNMNLHYVENGTVMLNFIYRKELFFLPLGFALKALVSFSDYQIFQELIKGKEEDSFFRNSVSQMLRIVIEEGCHSQKQVLNYLGECFRVKLSLPDWYPNVEAAEFLLNQCICIHLQSNTDKFYLLCLMTRKLFALARGECMDDNPDSLVNQEVLSPGQLFLMFLKEKMENWLVSIKIVLDKRAQKANVSINNENLMKIFSMGTELTRPFEYLLATGNLRSKTGLGFLQDSGLCVVADKLNFLRYLSHFRCVHRGAAFAKMRTTTVRRLLPESWGFLCPVHTPDGAPCGLLNHLTAVCEESLLLIQRHVDRTVTATLSCWMASWWAGWIRTLLLKLQTLSVDSRLVRPVQNLELGREELIGTMEQLFMNVAIFEDEVFGGISTHQELFPHSLLSVIANFIPFSDHNQSPRNMYQCQMGKQTMGFPLLTYQNRSDNKLYRLQTPQSPLVRPCMYDFYDMDNYPIGTNAIVAVISYTGYDMEDAMIVNKASWERGFAHGSVYKSEFIDLSEKFKQGEDNLVFGVKPGDPRVMQKLDDDGLPFIGAKLEYGDPYYSYLNLNTGEGFVVYYKSKENCVVDNIKVCSNDMGSGKFKCICITVRIPRNPTIGDKFASRHGQKGILSRLWPAEDMPFTESGMMPDILFNPHGFPSRMTIGMLIESMAGKSAALHGLCHDATPFIFSEENSALEYFGEMLKAAGYNFYGTERLYSGISGMELEADIFIGVVYYQRLRHMVSDKFQVRTTGARDKVTNQPLGGRNVQGGIRFGEMERDALLAHGTSFLLHDRLFNCSDRSVAHMCVECGSLLSPLLEKPPPSWSAMRNRKYNCTVCGRSDTIDTVSVPYVFRYFVAELAAMNIKVKLDVI
ncbi:DNA-directed RNA polymerase I subunit RPA2 isoform X1 [Mus musculus]|uniref:DNA-directed RNA polymerase I subunit RPA2 isoform X1 n=1 Tax=Mus musculus TaxID=10090 RepID=UPI0003D74E40|nr:DNA-directed RNA polymerase I subunit RPA2 isoform X1 [Mus musculus]|eukprot:XP_006499088.1 PREDICTED: DNA-directed RNA polymerase I subunit RPA2 isoform X1 [Mus musculus]